MNFSTPLGRSATLSFVVGLVGLVACDQSPTAPDRMLEVKSLGSDGDVVTEPIKIQFRAGSFVVVPSGDPRIPAGSATEDCPVGEENIELGLPAGFPNGGGVVVIHGTGEATHLGRFEYVQTQCAVRVFPVTDPPFVNFNLWSRLTGADGSEIIFEGPFARTFLTPSSVSRPIFDIVGGSGRFEAATGWVPESAGVEVTCTDSSGLCLEGTFTGGVTEGEVSVPQL